MSNPGPPSQGHVPPSPGQRFDGGHPSPPSRTRVGRILDTLESIARVVFRTGPLAGGP